MNAHSNKHSVLKLSRVVAGVWRMKDWNNSVTQRLDYIHHCSDVGMTTFDHADIYGDYQCESLFGEALANNSALRQKIQLVTKCGINLISKHYPQRRINQYDTSYQHIIDSVENSLKRLATDYIDCLLIHRPDPLMQADDIALAFHDLIRDGKILHAGVSNFLPQQISLIQSRCDFPLAINQVEISVEQTESLTNGVLDYCQQHAMTPMAWSPFCGGRLFTSTEKKLQDLRFVLEKIGVEYQKNSMQVALAWLLKHPAGIRPIIGSGNFDRIGEAAESDFVLSNEHWFQIYQQSRGKAID